MSRLFDLPFHGPPCKQCGGTEWRTVSVPTFRVEECTACQATRAVTDSRPVHDTVVYVVVESWGHPLYVRPVNVFVHRDDAERDAEARTKQARLDREYQVQYLVEQFPVN